MPERMRSDRRIEEVTPGVGDNGPGGSRDNAAMPAGEATALATGAASKMNDQPSSEDSVVRAMAIYRQATATAWAGLQALFLLPLHNFQSWQEAWLRLLPR